MSDLRINWLVFCFEAGPVNVSNTFLFVGFGTSNFDFIKFSSRFQKSVEKQRKPSKIETRQKEMRR